MNTSRPDREHGVVSTRALSLLSEISVSEPLGASNLSELVAQKIESALSVGILNEGDRLPPESVLAEYMGVSPLVLRHGLSLLRQRSLVGTKRGRHGGSYIRSNLEIDEKDVNARLRAFTTDDLRDLHDTAAVLATGAVRLASSRADHQDIERLRLRNKQVLEADSGSSLRRALSRFHISLGIAAQSKGLTSHLVRVHVALAPISWPHLQAGERQEKAFEERELIIAGIEHRKTDEAVAQMLDYAEAEQILAVKRHLELISAELRSHDR